MVVFLVDDLLHPSNVLCTHYVHCTEYAMQTQFWGRMWKKSKINAMYVTHVLCLCRNHNVNNIWNYILATRLSLKTWKICIQCWKWLTLVLCLLSVLHNNLYVMPFSIFYLPSIAREQKYRIFIILSKSQNGIASRYCHFSEIANNNCIRLQNHRSRILYHRKGDIESWFGWWLLVVVKIMISDVG